MSRGADSRCCDFDRLGLTDDELAALTGFTTRMAQMLAHLRDAWCSADDGNAFALERALFVMLEHGHSFNRNRRVIAKILSHGLDSSQREKLLSSVGLAGPVVSVWNDDAGELLPCPELHKLLMRGERCPRCDAEKR